MLPKKLSSMRDTIKNKKELLRTSEEKELLKELDYIDSLITPGIAKESTDISSVSVSGDKCPSCGRAF